MYFPPLPLHPSSSLLPLRVSGPKWAHHQLRVCTASTVVLRLSAKYQLKISTQSIQAWRRGQTWRKKKVHILKAITKGAQSFAWTLWSPPWAARTGWCLGTSDVCRSCSSSAVVRWKIRENDEIQESGSESVWLQRAGQILRRADRWGYSSSSSVCFPGSINTLWINLLILLIDWT